MRCLDFQSYCQSGFQIARRTAILIIVHRSPALYKCQTPCWSQDPARGAKNGDRPHACTAEGVLKSFRLTSTSPARPPAGRVRGKRPRGRAEVGLRRSRRRRQCGTSSRRRSSSSWRASGESAAPLTLAFQSEAGAGCSSSTQQASGQPEKLLKSKLLTLLISVGSAFCVCSISFAALFWRN